MTGADAARAAIERELGSALADEEWEFLVEEGHAGEVGHLLAGDGWAEDDALEQVVQKIKRLRRTYNDRSRNPSRFLVERQRSDPGNPVEALSVIVALDAARDPEVVKFRTEVLSCGLLVLEQIEEWIGQTGAADGPPTMYLKVPKPPGMALIYDEKTQSMRLSPPLVVEEPLAAGFFGSDWETLQYPVADGCGMNQAYIRHNGVLYRLKELAHRLSNTYGWSDIQAVGFVLAGLPPELSAVSAKLDYRRTVPALSALDLRISVVAELKEVEAMLVGLRQVLLGAQPRRRSRKHLALAVFAAEGRGEGKTGATKTSEPSFGMRPKRGRAFSNCRWIAGPSWILPTDRPTQTRSADVGRRRWRADPSCHPMVTRR
jgi:hypothetical protein